MVELNKKYGDKGLQMLGISLDSNKEQMLAVAKTKGFSWPQYFDGQGWQNKLWAQWGSDGIPFTVLVDPTGKVQYAGHPAGGLDQAIETVFKNTPPYMVDPQVVSAGNQALDQVEAKLTAHDARARPKRWPRFLPKPRGILTFSPNSKPLKRSSMRPAKRCFPKSNR